jgi:riboflavin kinase/FMN adenylyltransferase
VDSHLLNFSGDIYGHEATVEFLKFLRPERSFADGEALRQQIAKDIRQALDYHA